ncbi:MAG: PilN domain-containing protein [Desulfuromonadaceae bacterium]|nr:PilN domain-containing protein [Desulfuromonadaceae bacterium]MDD2855600.1 PilN domain-containing protein [Desulfuromonadaceae bacterium]
MIKINLLPVRVSKKKETAIQQIIIAAVVVVLIAGIITSLYVVKRVQVAAAKDDIVAANNKVKELKAKIGKIEEIKTLKEQVKKKLDVLNQLRKNKTGPAQRLSTLSDMTPKQLWLTNYSEAGENIKISGVAYTEDLIAQFMRDLEASSDFAGVELLLSQQADVEGIKLKKFDVTMKLESTAPQP